MKKIITEVFTFDIEMDAADTFRDEAHYFAEHRVPNAIPHKQLIELMAELYRV